MLPLISRSVLILVPVVVTVAGLTVWVLEPRVTNPRLVLTSPELMVTPRSTLGLMRMTIRAEERRVGEAGRAVVSKQNRLPASNAAVASSLDRVRCVKLMCTHTYARHVES